MTHFNLNKGLFFVSVLLTLLFFGACKTVSVNVLGLKTFTFPDEKPMATTQKKEKHNGLYPYSKVETGGIITGQIVISDQKAASYATISIVEIQDDYRQEVWKSFYTNKDGNFQILNIPYGKYKLASSTTNSYLSVVNPIEITSDAPAIHLNIVLKPITQSKEE